MLVLLCVLVALAALGAGAAVLVAGQLRSSDAAGNGLAQAYLVVVVAVTWIVVGISLLIAGLQTPHANCPPELPWRAFGWAAAACWALALLGQVAGLAALFDGGSRGALRMLLQAGAGVVPLAFVLHVAWRGLGLPLPATFATLGLLAVVTIGSLLPAVACLARRAAAATAAQQQSIAYPALCLRDDRDVRVLRGAEDLRAVPADTLDVALLIDANGATWTAAPLAGQADTTAGAEPELAPGPVLPFAAIDARVLAIERLHADPAEDAKVRRLVAMQADVTALTFVLPR
jgi:hypothetical protein